MAESTSSTTRIAEAQASLDVDFATPAAGVLQVRYRLRNGGAEAIAVFDRGNRHAVLTGQQVRGAVGMPLLREDADGRIILQHVAIRLPNPAPTLPPTPLATRVAPGHALEDGFTFSRWLGDPPRHVRWCLGVAPFDAADFHAPDTVDGIEIWQASFALADRQRLLCTPWFDVANGVFLSPG
ncbi:MULTISPECIES: hypothetical protein [Luteimonas]|uniref:hypothetical protein n=1 Tax=Luteimonas TaxID=83614 RepID=UPI000C7E281E|nr:MULTISPECIES: hypothetical protein [Luteimonas]